MPRLEREIQTRALEAAAYTGWLTEVTNGAAGYITGGSSGVLSRGFPDTLWMRGLPLKGYQGPLFVGALVEFKRPENVRLNENQKLYHAHTGACGIRPVVATSEGVAEALAAEYERLRRLLR